jgi:hypothetical protein
VVGGLALGVRPQVAYALIPVGAARRSAARPAAGDLLLAMPPAPLRRRELGAGDPDHGTRPLPRRRARAGAPW